MSWGMAGVADQQGWRKGPWTPEEDNLLTDYVTHHGEGRWSSVSRCAGLNRSGKSCRLRWVNYLRPGLKRSQITPQEEGIIIELHALWGNKWSTIARYLPGRTDNEIKNYWRTHFKKRDRLPSRQSKTRKPQTQKQAPHSKQITHTTPQRQPLQQGEFIGETTKLNTTSATTHEDNKLMAPNCGAMDDCHFGQLINYPNNEEDLLWSGSLWSFNEPQGAVRDKAPTEQEQLCSKVANMANQATFNDFNGFSWGSGDYANYNMTLLYDDGYIF